jgi:hypothetical protein
MLPVGEPCFKKSQIALKIPGKVIKKIINIANDIKIKNI